MEALDNDKLHKCSLFVGRDLGCWEEHVGNGGEIKHAKYSLPHVYIKESLNKRLDVLGF